MNIQKDINFKNNNWEPACRLILSYSILTCILTLHTLNVTGQGKIELGSGVWNQFEEQFSNCSYPFDLYYGCSLAIVRYDFRAV